MIAKLLDVKEGKRRRDKAIETVDQNANAAWKALALEAVRRVCLFRPFFTTDDVWEQIGEKDPLRENRVMGAVMVKARKLQYCETTDRIELTKQPGSHASPARVWRSRIFQGELTPAQQPTSAA